MPTILSTHPLHRENIARIANACHSFTSEHIVARATCCASLSGICQRGWSEVTLTPTYPTPSLTGRTFPNPGWHLPTNIRITPQIFPPSHITGTATLLWIATHERLSDTLQTCFEVQVRWWVRWIVAKICQPDSTWSTARPSSWL